MIKTPDGKIVNVDFTPYQYMSKDDVELYIKLGMPKRQSPGPLDSEKLQKMAQIKGIAMLDPKMARAGMEEGHRDPEDWDEGNTEPPNNFAVYINGKKWKVFKGRGQFADDYKEIQHYRQLRTWAEKKSAETGKKWTVSVTGEPATESMDEGWKEKLAAAGLAGAMALGSGNAAARVSGDEDPSINRLTGKPIATQVSPADSEKGDATSPLSSRYTSGAKWPAAYTIEYEGETYKFAGRTEAAPKGGKEIKVPAALVGVRGLGAATVTLGKDGKYYAGSAD